MPPAAPDFSWHFTPGNAFRDENGDLGTLSVAAGGTLWLPSGRLVACDPMAYPVLEEGVPPFHDQVSPGRYRLEAALVTWSLADEPPQASPYRDLAAVRLVITEEPTASWEPALSGARRAGDLGPDELQGYGVDAGLGAFHDAAAWPDFADREATRELLRAPFLADGYRHPGPYVITGPEGHQVAVFQSGWGDGVYPTWTGRDEHGGVTCFLTDFFVVPTEREATA
ncbi:DUF4241 domain-containing protein [Streptomyces sp. NPDC001581]|uniref:DUF4241 domain-containing protein n=1 Tax=Streptomyces sp. NPDC001581 TaxID=3154386 RepID=UPI0033224CAC